MAKTNGVEGGLALEFDKKGISLEEAAALFPTLVRRRAKYLPVAQSILERVDNLDPKIIWPCELTNSDPEKNPGLVHFVNVFLKQNNSDWRMKESPIEKRYGLYNLALLGKNKK